MSRRDSPVWQEPHPQPFAGVGEDMEPAKLALGRSLNLVGRRAGERLSGADRHLPHITNCQRKVRDSALSRPTRLDKIKNLLHQIHDQYLDVATVWL